MSYATIETALATSLQSATGFSSANVAQSDYRCLAKGVTQAAILMPGSFNRSRSSLGRIENVWTINLELWVLWAGEQSTIMSTIKSARQNLIDRVDADPGLSGTSGLTITFLGSGGEPEFWQSGARQFWKQVMTVEIREITSV